MSKSKGNFYTLRDLVDKGATPAAIRLELIRTHYRSNANFTLQGLKDSQRQVERWRRLADWLQQHSSVHIDGVGHLQSAIGSCLEAMCDDLNVAGAIGVLSEAVGQYAVDETPLKGSGEHTLADELVALNEMDAIFGVLDLAKEVSTGDLDVSKIDSLIEARLKARSQKEWLRADEIRDELLAMGVSIKDGSDGTTWSRILQ